MKGYTQASSEYYYKITDPYYCPYKITDKECPECGDVLIVDNDGFEVCLSCGWEEE